MKASILDLRYKTRDILNALGNGEEVTVTERGKMRGVIHPVKEREKRKVEEHPFFGMDREWPVSVEEEMNVLRRSRYDV